jgi:hypothetical protein
LNWGQGTNTNNISWGQAILNLINWGYYQLISWSGLTDITGISVKIANDFENRVIADSGVFEAKECLIKQIRNEFI